MNHRFAIPILIIVILAVGTLIGLQIRRARLTPPPDPTPELFREKLNLIQARDAAKARGVPVLVYATAAWCETCRKLEAGALNDPDFQAWARQHTVPVLMDLDLVQGSGSAFNIASPPTLLMVQRGRELGRVEGFHPPGDIIRQLQTVLDSAPPSSDPAPTEAPETSAQPQAQPG